MSYQSFGSDWEKEMVKISKKELESAFGVSGQGILKKEQIKQIRHRLLVKQFNEQHPVGSKIGFMLYANEPESGRVVTVVAPGAFISRSGQAVVFFQERAGYCSIEPQFIYQP